MEEVDFTAWYYKMFKVQRILSYIIIGTLIVINLGVLSRLKFRLDAWGYFTLTLHLFVSAIRIFGRDLDNNWDEITNYNMMSYISQLLVWISMYHFTFEILLIKNALDHQKQSKSINVVRYFFLLYLTIVGINSLIQWKQALSLNSNPNEIFRHL